MFTHEVQVKFTIGSTTDQVQRTCGIALSAKSFQKLASIFLILNPEVVHPDILRIMYGLLVQGRSRFEEISLFRFDTFSKQAFNLKYVPATETLRLYLENIAEAKDYALEKIS